jgi:hypothetical protein
MANTKIPAELSSTPGIIDNSNATAITIDSSENVGIGTVPESWNSAFRALDIGVNGALISQTASGGDELHLISNGYYDGAWKYKESNSANQIILNNGAITFEKAASGTANAALTWEETMRIDSSGNLLVGTTDVDLGYTDGDSGVVLTPDGFIQAARNSAYSILYLNKLNNDGPLIDFHKDGSTVGSICVQSSTLQIGTGNTQFAFSDADDAFFVKNAAGTPRDNSHDLGKSNARFKDLYLSGGVVFDAVAGNATSNTLDDYEEGSWSPTIATGTAGISAALYTKVGRLVMCQFIIDTFSDRVSGNAVVVGNLPFAAEATNRPVTIGCLGSFTSSSFGSVTGGYLDSTTTLRLYNTSTGAFRFLKHSDLTSASTNYYVAFTYTAA